ncbi:MAG: glycoside hydrolase family 99-like domain-containing protein [Methylomicrobium sp.]
MPFSIIRHRVKSFKNLTRILREILGRRGGFKAIIRKTYTIFREEGFDGLKQRLSTSLVEKDPFLRLEILESYANERFLTANNKVTWGSRYVPKVSDNLELSHLPLKAIAFYLPQFHPIPENDLWWGQGFTEWTNVSKAQPQFLGHYQPHLPDELGFYDLRLPEIMHQQIELARKYGVSGFCFHYYWFGGKRLLELPINNFLADPSMNIDFCFCWANENWSRRWDGSEDDILMAQNHSPEDDIAFIEAMLPAFSDPRYIRIDDKPLLIVYRVSMLPDAKATADRWRKRVREMGFSDLYLVVARTFDITDPRPYGFDAAVEFPPHQVNVPPLTRKFKIINSEYHGNIFEYAHLAEKYGQQTESQFVNFKTVVPSWDNEARKPGSGHSFANALPELYAKWLSDAAQITLQYKSEERLLFINAWNEWAEGAHLEPDRHHGYAYLHATANVLRNLAISEDGVSKLITEINANFSKRFNIAVILHVYYEDLIDPIFSTYLSPLQETVDLFVTVKKDISLNALVKIREWFPNVYILMTENRGRDIRPFLLAYKQVQQQDYQYAAKLHTKKSPHRLDGGDWREGLMSSLVGSPDQVTEIVRQFLLNDKLGLLVPPGSLTDLSIPDIHVDNKKWLDLLLARLGARDQIGRYSFHFPAGSMYWFRVSALSLLLDESVISIDEFELEAGQLDGTLAHSVERIIGLLPSRLDYQVRELTKRAI